MASSVIICSIIVDYFIYIHMLCYSIIVIKEYVTDVYIMLCMYVCM